MSRHSSLSPCPIAAESVTFRTTSVRSNPDTLMTECRECSGAGLRTHDHPGDPWARTFQCRECEGTGEVVADCECCNGVAVEVFDGLKLCGSCAAEQRADAESVA